MSGQLNNRDKRLQRTAEWLRAEPVGPRKQKLLDAAREISTKEVSQIAAQIRASLANHVNTVHVDGSVFGLREGLEQELTPDELNHVVFHISGAQVCVAAPGTTDPAVGAE